MEALARKCQCMQEEKDERYEVLYKVIEEYCGKPGPLIPVLHKVQQLFGYVPRDVQEIISEELDVPVSQIDGVITFYSFFSSTPQGQHRIGICLGTACYVKGADKVLEELKKQLRVEVGQTTEDGRFTLEVTRCLGACGLAPVMMIDDDVYGRLTPDKVADILDKYNDK